MRHAATAILLCLALLSGIVLTLVSGQPPLRSSSIQAVTSQDLEETVLTFYGAVNTYLNDGDDALVRRLLHPNFVNHDPGSLAGGNSAGFMQQLDSIRALFPGIQLEPEVLYLGNNVASVSLSLNDRQQREFAGIGIDPADIVGRFDLVRLERRLIVERWSSAPLAGELDAYPSLSIELPFALNRLIAKVQQFSFDGDPELTTYPFEHLLLIVQSGEPRLEVVDSGVLPVTQWRMVDDRRTRPAPIEPGTTVTLDRMTAVFLPAGTRFRMWDSSDRDTTLLALEFGPPVMGEVSPQTPSIVDALKQTLWSGISLQGVGDRLTLSFGRASLLPKSTLSSRDIAGMELAWVSGGSIEMAASSGTARIRKASGVRSQPNDGAALLQTGDAGAAGPDTDIDYRVAGKTTATVWFFSIVPASIESSQHETGAPTPIPTVPPPRTAS